LLVAIGGKTAATITLATADEQVPLMVITSYCPAIKLLKFVLDGF
jgi:hypothetical protein